MNISIPMPELQVSFSQSLSDIRDQILQEALKNAVARADISKIDAELGECVSKRSLSTLASFGMRGELLFPVPTVLEANPRLLGYYRLLYGYSQKEFYQSTVAGPFKGLEDRGDISKKNSVKLLELCKAMALAGEYLLDGIQHNEFGPKLLYDLTLLSLGPQFRGGANVQFGAIATARVFDLIREIVIESIIDVGPRHMKIRNAANRSVLIDFASDPDIIIRELLSGGDFRKILAIEVKGGRDYSNVHNRIGEAEKSHQKSRSNKYTECWTILNVERFDLEMARRESPSTDRFYLLKDIKNPKEQSYSDFRDRIVSLTGIHFG